MAWLQDAAKDRSPWWDVVGDYSREVGKCASLSTAEYFCELLKRSTKVQASLNCGPRQSFRSEPLHRPERRRAPVEDTTAPWSSPDVRCKPRQGPAQPEHISDRWRGRSSTPELPHRLYRP